MTYPLSKIDGLHAHTAAKLKSIGIRTTEALLETASSLKGRRLLAERIGICEKQVLDWANKAQFLLVPGIGPGKTELLRTAGVTTVRELALRNPKKLAAAMRDANAKRKLVEIMPSEVSVGKLIERAKKLPPKITY